MPTWPRRTLPAGIQTMVVHGFGSQTPPTIQAPLQFACAVIAQLPPRAQHAPPTVGGSGQLLGSQSPPWCHKLGDTHDTCVVTVQVPAGAQQEPVGCWQGFGSQAVPSPEYVSLWEAHAVPVMTTHEPSRKQQAPVTQLKVRSARLRGLICQPVVYGEVVSY